MKRIAVICAIAALLSFEASATPNLPMVCTTSAVNAACPGDIWTTAPGSDGKYVAVSGKGVIDWAAALPTDLVRVCPSDITPGTSCPVARISLAKSLAATASVSNPTWNVKFSWDAPTKDVEGAPLPAGDITGYVLSYHPKIGGDIVDIKLAANVLSYSTRIPVPRGGICARVTVIGKGGENITPENCKEPPPATAVIPAVPTNFELSFSP